MGIVVLRIKYRRQSTLFDCGFAATFSNNSSSKWMYHTKLLYAAMYTALPLRRFSELGYVATERVPDIKSNDASPESIGY